ncbi:MAG: putative nitrogen fixation protein NifT [Methylococcaceae bacterium]|jgi:nitrogen fixation protein NifT
MPSIMLRKREDGKLLFYVAKKDLEETIEAIEFDTPEKWGGEVTLGDGSRYYFEPMSPPPSIPTTLRAKRVDSGDDD